MAKKAIARTTLLVPCSINGNQATKGKEKGKAKERGVVAAERVNGVAGMVEVKAKEAKVRKAAGPGSRKATATTVKYTYTHVYLVAQMCVVKVVTRVGAH